MAQSDQNFNGKTKDILCRYFISGVCNKGESCSFSHNRDDKQSMVCTFYKAGKCSYGSKCRYDHVKPENSGNSAGKSEFDEETSGKDPAVNDCSLKLHRNWADAPEFVPGQPWMSSSFQSYSGKVKSGLCDPVYQPSALINLQTEMTYYCEYCSELIHPTDVDHTENCINFHETKMKHAFQVKVSCNKICGICLEVVWQKEPKSKQRFGILSHCNHVFCLDCIREWRCKDSLEGDTTRLCPECRLKSDFVVPSYYWFEDNEEKVGLVKEYKKALMKKPCKYFSERQFCPFDKGCFYLHLNPDGSEGQNSKRFKQDAEGMMDLIRTYKISDFIEQENNRREQASHSMSEDF